MEALSTALSSFLMAPPPVLWLVLVLSALIHWYQYGRTRMWREEDTKNQDKYKVAWDKYHEKKDQFEKLAAEKEQHGEQLAYEQLAHRLNPDGKWVPRWSIVGVGRVRTKSGYMPDEENEQQTTLKIKGNAFASDLPPKRLVEDAVYEAAVVLAHHQPLEGKFTVMVIRRTDMDKFPEGEVRA
ncbi:MAG TPA: hypothetical protein VF690_17495, partial [Hymenobacter sp.]